MINPRMHSAHMPDPDEDDRPIIRVLRRQIRERLAQMDVDTGPTIELEPSREALAREIREELGVEPTVGRLLWIIEKLF
jgi:8-oxo-dGTP pyrophosphatase MutT (NUDIX family)